MKNISDEKVERELAKLLARDSHGQLKRLYVELVGPLQNARGRPV